MYDNIFSQGQAQEINLIPLVALEVAINFAQIYIKSALFKLASESTYWDTQMEHKRISILTFPAIADTPTTCMYRRS